MHINQYAPALLLDVDLLTKSLTHALAYSPPNPTYSLTGVQVLQ